MEQPPLQPIGFIENVPPVPSRSEEPSAEPRPEPVVDFSKIPPLPTGTVPMLDESGVPKKEREPLSPEAEAFYNGEYQRVRTLVNAYAAEHPDEFGALNDAAARFVKSHFASTADAREYVLHHVCCGSSPDPKSLRFLDTEDNDFYNLIKTHTGLDVYAVEGEDEENDATFG